MGTKRHKASLIFWVLGMFVLAQFTMILPSKAADSACPPMVNGGAPISENPTYEYSKTDGLVIFHFWFSNDWPSSLEYDFFDANCAFVRSSWYPTTNANMAPAGHFILKAVKVGENAYNFRGYNEQGSDITHLLGQTLPSFGANETISVGFYNWVGSSVVSVFTPGVPVKDPKFQAPKTPVLIIPGITGTELYNESDWVWLDVLDLVHDDGSYLLNNLALNQSGNSINQISVGGVVKEMRYTIPVINLDVVVSNIFQGLLDNLESNGYIQDETVFFFPYDWRLDLNETKDKLNQKIEVIKLQTGSSKVDIIAHSMGGLLTKAYLNDYGNYSLGKLIFVGTPHLGSPEAGKIILEGDNYNVPWVKSSVFKELINNMPAAYELLPNQKYFEKSVPYLYLYNPKSIVPKGLSYNDTKNYLLETKSRNADIYLLAENFFSKRLEDMNFTDINVFNITGCNTGTQAGYQLGKNNDHIEQVGYNQGDGTVPFFSSDYINIPPSKKYYVKNAKHSSLASTIGVKELITNILNGKNINLYENISNSPDFCSLNGKVLEWKSPVEVHIYKDGHHAGPIAEDVVEYGISDINYDIIGHNKFIFLPTDEGQQYQVMAKGLDTGTFDLRVSEIDNGQYLTTQVFNDVPVNTTTQVSLLISETSQDNILEINQNGQVIQVSASASLEGEQVLDLVPPITTASTTGERGDGGWYKSNVSLSLTATDEGVGVLNTYYKLDSDGTYKTYVGPIEIIDEGVRTISYYSVDKAGNNEEIKSLEIKIDKTSPEFAIQFDVQTKDFDLKAIDDNFENMPASCTETQCVAKDQAGNETVIKFSKTRALLWHLLSLDSVSYNGTKAGLKDNLFWVKFLNNKDILKDLNQTVVVKGQEVLRIDYKKSKDESRVMDFTKEKSGKKVTLPGLKFIEILTSKNKLNIRY